MRRVFNAAHGDYVLCCKYSDRSKGDQWQVGYLDYAVNFHNSGNDRDNVFVMQDPQRSYFKCCYLITPAEGQIICETKNPSAVKCYGDTPKILKDRKSRISEFNEKYNK